MSKEFYDYLYNWAEDRNKKREEIQERKNQVNNFANSINERNNNNQNNMQNLQIQRTDILNNSNNTLKQQTVGENLWKQIFETARQNLANDISNTVDNAVLGFKKGINNVSETFSNAMYNTMNSRAQMSDEMRKNALDASLKREKDPEKQKQIQNEINNQDYLMSPTNLQKESNSQKQKYEEKNQELEKKIYNNIEQTSNPIAGKLAEISSSVGQMSPALIPGVGLPYMVASSKTDYLREAKQRGMDDNDSEIYSGIMSLTNGVTGNIAIGKVGKTTQNFVNNLDGLKTLKEVGINLGNNFVQSAIMRPIGELTSKIVAGDDSLQYDYNNGGFKKLLSDSVKDGCDGAIMAGMLQLGTMGLTSPMRVYNKMKNGEKVNNQEIKTAFNEAKQKGIDVDNIITENFGKTLQQNQNNESLVKKDLSELPTMQDNKVTQQTTYQATKNANKSNVVTTEGNHFNSQKNADKIKEIIQNDSNISADDKKAIIDATETLLKDNKFDKKNTIDAINSIKELSNVVADENKLDIGKKYLSGRKEIYNNYKKMKEYDNTAVENAKSLVRANAQGKRTKEQWLQVAKQIGTEIADKSDKEIQKIAYKSWQHETPNTVDTLNRQGKKYVRLTSDDWIDEIYKSVSEQREKSGYKPKNETIEKLDNLYKEIMDENTKASVSPTEKNDLINSAKEYSLDGNSEDIQGISKMLSQRDIPAKFDVELFKDKDGNIDTNRNAVWKTYKDEKGNSKREIVFNPYADTKKTVQQVAVHELWHDMGGTEEGKKLAEQILKRNSKQKGYQEARANLESTYSKVYDKNNEKFKSLVDDEEVADTLAQRLGDKDFIESLNKENKTAFQKIYDWVIDKLNKFTGGKVEKLYWQDVKNKFENVYKEEYKNTNKQNSKYSIQTDINGNKYIKVDTDQDIFEGIEPKDYNKIAKMYMQDYLKGETILNKNDSVNIGSKGINKYTNPTQKNKYLSEKMELTPELKNVLEIAKKVSDSTPTKDTSKFPNWQYYKFKFELGGKFFEGLINIGVDKTGNKHFYEINRIHPTSNSYVSTNKFSRMDPIKNNIAPNKNDVNTTTKYSMQGIEKNTQNTIKINNDGEAKYIDNKRTEKPIYFRFDEEGQFKGRKHKSGVSMWEDQIDDMISDNYHSYFDENDNFIEKNPLLEKYGITQEQYDEMNIEEQRNIAQEIALDEGMVTNGASVFDLSDYGIDFFWNYEKDHSYLDSPEVHFFTGEVTGEGVDGENVVIPEKVLFKGDSKDIKKIYDELYYKYDLDNPTERDIANKEFTQKVVDLINKKNIESENNSGSFNLQENKKKQLDIIEKNNKMQDDYHTGIRKIEDIKTLAETLRDSDWKEYEEFNPDYTRKMADEALKTGKITVYSSHPIEQGSFVSPSKMEAESYSGNGKIYSKEININDVAWIDPTQGQYAKLNQNSDKNSDIRYSQNNESKWEKFLKESVGGKTKGKRLSELRVPTKENLELIRKMKSENPFTVLYNTDKDSDNTMADNTVNNEIGENNKENPNDKTIRNKKETSNNDNGGKFRKHYKSIMESDLPEETRKIAKKLLGTDTYEPSSNQKIIEEADNSIATIGADESAKNIALKLYNNDKLTANDIAVGERLIQYYSKTGEWEKAQDTIQNVAMAGTELGQAVQAFSLIHKQTPIGQVVAMKKFVEKQNKNIDKKTKGKGKKFDLTDDMVQKILNSDPDHLEDTIDEVSRELGQQVPKTLIQKLDSWRYFSMLFNARTHIRNIIGNIGMGKMINPIKNVVGASIETVAQKAGLIDERTKTLKPANKETKEFAKADFANVKDIITNESKFDSRNLIQKYQRTFKHDVFEKTLGKLYDLNSNLLEKEDVFACKSAYKEALSNYMTANKLTPEYLKSGTKEANKALEKGRKYAIQQAQDVTFRQKNSLATLLNQLEDKNKLSKLIVGGVVPFKKIPLNIAKTGFEYSPVGIVRAFTTDLQKLRQNEINANQYIGNLSKGLTGTGIAVVGFSLANAGIITTGEDDNDKKQAFDEDRGSQTYSISIGGKSYSLDWAAPSVIPFFMGAGIYEAYVKPNDGSATGTKMEAVGKSIDSIIESLNPLVDMSMLSGLGSAIQSYQTDSTGAISTFITNAGKSYVGQFVPTLSKQIAKTVDDTERSTTSMEKNGLAKVVDSLRKQTINGIPFASKNLPAKTDIWGETKKKSPNVFERFLQQSILPWNEKSLKSTDVDKAVLDLYDKTGDPSALPKSNINKELTINSEKYRLNNEDFIQYKKEYGQQSYKLLQQLTASNEYKKMSDDQKLKAVSAIYTYANENNTIDYAKKHNIDKKPSSDYNSVKAIEKNGGNAGDYFKYLGQTQGMDKSSEKLNVLINSNIENKSKSAIYSNTIGSKDDQYNLFISKTGINVNEYLKFKKETSTSGSLQSDKDKDGKNISGSKEKKVLEYINNMKISTNQKLALFGTQFALPTSQKTQLINYISATVSHNDLTDVIKKYKKQNYKIDSNGNVTY